MTQADPQTCPSPGTDDSKPPTLIDMNFLNDNDPPPAPPCPTSTDDNKPPPPPERKSPAPADNEVPGSLKLQGDNSENAGDDQSKNGLFLATNGAMAAEAASGGEVSGSNLPVGQPSYLTPMSQRPKPDYELPTDSNGQPYGPMCIHHNANPANAEKWDDALAHWKQHEATPGEVATYEHAQTYRLDTWTKINDVRVKKDPAMPTFSNIAYEEIPYTLEGIDALRPKLNEVELDYIGTLTAVAETDPRHPTKTDCYCTKSGRHWHKAKGNWHCLNMNKYETQLIAEGFDGGRSKKAERGSEVSEIIRKVTLRPVSLAGAWSGHAEGLHVAISGKSYLCTKDSPIPKLEHGDFAHLWSFVSKLFGEDVDPHYLTQVGLFLVWMQHAITALQRRNKECPSRLLVLTGEQGNGKSTLVNKIICPAFGGRAVSAKLMVSGKTAFNNELAEAELITFDDIPNKLSPCETANTLKTLLVGHELGMLVHAKNQDALTIPVLHRLVWCCNNDPNALKQLPKMRAGDGLIDKVITLRTHDTHLSGMSGDVTEAHRNKLTEQVPAFLEWLMSPAADEYASGVSRDGRGPKAWMHPEIESELLDMSPEQHLLGMLRLVDEQDQWDAGGNTANTIDMALSQLYRGRYEKLVGGSVVKLGLMLGTLAANGTIDKAHKSPNSKAANKWIVAGISRKLGAEE